MVRFSYDLVIRFNLASERSYRNRPVIDSTFVPKAIAELIVVECEKAC